MDLGWITSFIKSLSNAWRRNLMRLQGRGFKNMYGLLNLRACKFSFINKLHIFQCIGKIFCVEFQMFHLKFRKKYHTHTLKEAMFIQYWKFKSSQIYKLISISWDFFFKLSMSDPPCLRQDVQGWSIFNYRQVSNIRHQIPILKRFSYCLVAVFAPNPLKPDVKSRMKM